MTKGGTKMPRTVCGHCCKDVAYSLPASGTVAYLMPHKDDRTGDWCVRNTQSADPRPLIDVLVED